VLLVLGMGDSVLHVRHRSDLKFGLRVWVHILFASLDFKKFLWSLYNANTSQALFVSLKKQAETLFRLICCERKTLFRLKNKLKSTDYKTSEQGLNCLAASTRATDSLLCYMGIGVPPQVFDEKPQLSLSEDFFLVACSCAGYVESMNNDVGIV